MKNKITWITLLGIAVIAALITVSLLSKKGSTIDVKLTSYKEDTLELGTYKGRMIGESTVIQNREITFELEEQETFRNEIKNHKSYISEISKEDYYIFKVDTSFFYIDLRLKRITFGNLMSYFIDGNNEGPILEIYDFPTLQFEGLLNEVTTINQSLFTFEDLVKFCQYLSKDRYEITEDTIKLKSTAGLIGSISELDKIKMRDDYSLEIKKNKDYYDIKIIKWYEDANEFVN